MKESECDNIMNKSIKDIDMAKKIATLVANSGGSTFFVGGFVRDKILGKENKDIDIEVHGITTETLRDILNSLGVVVEQGASFGVFNIKGFDIDISQPRKEKKIGNCHTSFDISIDPFIGIEKACKRRDFTINSMMIDVLTGNVIDPFNGKLDLENKIIRHIDDNSFGEDPLRVLRAAQFAARFNFSIAEETKEIMRKMDLSNLSKERVFEEMKKALLKSDKPSIFFNILREINQLDVWFPEVKNLIGVCANAKNHPEGDTWNHTMIVLDYAANLKKESSNPEFFMISALAHDFGKPISESTDDLGFSHSYGHQISGVPVAKEFLNRLNNSKDMAKFVLNMVEMHMAAHFAFNNNSKIIKTNHMFDNSVSPIDLVLLAEADSSSKNKDKAILERNFLMERLDIYNKRISEPQVTGKDLIDLGLKPGPEFSEIIKESHKLHLSGIDKNSVIKHIKTTRKIH